MTGPSADFRSAILAAARRGAWPEVRAELSTHPEVASSQPELLTLLAEALLRLGRPAEAREWLRGGMERLVRSGDRAALRRGLNLAGAAAFNLGDLPDAERAFERALELARMDGDDLLVARATNNLGLIANSRGRHLEAVSLFLLAIPAYQRLGHVAGLAESYHNMGIAYRQMTQLGSAEDAERRALEFAREAGNARLAAMALVGRAEITLAQGDAALAEVTGLRGAAEFARLGDAALEADALRLAAVARHSSGRSGEAAALLDRAVTLAEGAGNTLIEAESRQARALIRRALGDAAGADADARRAEELFAHMLRPGETGGA